MAHAHAARTHMANSGGKKHSAEEAAHCNGREGVTPSDTAVGMDLDTEGLDVVGAVGTPSEI